MADLEARATPGAHVIQNGPHAWRLEIPSGPAGRYRWAQLDDYMRLPRSKFLHKAPTSLELRARVSQENLPGTWGFGLWNDPFNASLGLGGMARRLPALPNAAWFFYASPPNHLAFRDTHAVDGLLAASFSSPVLSSWVLAPALPGLAMLAWPPTARLARRAASAVIAEDAARLELNAADWHTYRLEWTTDACRFWADGALRLDTPVSPRGWLGLVLWIDNQYAAFPPGGKMRMGTLESPSDAWLEIELQE